MPRISTLAQLRAEVRDRADCENDPHITDAQVDRRINQSGAALHALIVDQDEGDFVSTLDISTVGGSETLDLGPAPTFYKLLHVHATVSGVVRELERWTFERYTLYQNASSWGFAGFPISYRLIRAGGFGAPSLWFAPKPEAAYPLRIFYVAAYNDLVGDGDAYDGRDGWEEWVVLDAAIKCLVKGEESTRDLVAERDAVFARISSQIRSADLDHPSTVRDTVNAGLASLRRYEVR